MRLVKKIKNRKKSTYRRIPIVSDDSSLKLNCFVTDKIFIHILFNSKLRKNEYSSYI